MIITHSQTKSLLNFEATNMAKPEPGAVTRLQRELVLLQKDPVPFIRAKPDGENILEWHYVLEGPPDTPYFGGFYHGMIKFPPNYRKFPYIPL